MSDAYVSISITMMDPMNCVKLAVIDVKLVQTPRNVSLVMLPSIELLLNHYVLVWQNIMIQEQTVKIVYLAIIHA